MPNNELVSKIVEFVGGVENIKSATNCITRLRLTIVDNKKINEVELRKVNGVVNLVMDKTLQIVVGPGRAAKVLEVCIKDYNIKKTV